MRLYRNNDTCLGVLCIFDLSRLVLSTCTSLVVDEEELICIHQRLETCPGRQWLIAWSLTRTSSPVLTSIWKTIQFLSPFDPTVNYFFHHQEAHSSWLVCKRLSRSRPQEGLTKSTTSPFCRP